MAKAQPAEEEAPAPKPLVWLHKEIKTPPFMTRGRQETGTLLRQLQQGEQLGMPQAEPLPDIGKHCSALRVRDVQHNIHQPGRIGEVLQQADVVDHIERSQRGQVAGFNVSFEESDVHDAECALDEPRPLQMLTAGVDTDDVPHAGQRSDQLDVGALVPDEADAGVFRGNAHRFHRRRGGVVADRVVAGDTTSTIQRAADAQTGFGHSVRVARRGGNVLVAEQMPHCPDVRSAFFLPLTQGIIPWPVQS